jgi:hypothetical protein
VERGADDRQSSDFRERMCLFIERRAENCKRPPRRGSDGGDNSQAEEFPEKNYPFFKIKKNKKKE